MELINLNRVRGNRCQRSTRDLLTCLLDFACNSSFQLDTTTSRVATDKKSSDPLRDVSRKRHFERTHFVQTRYICVRLCANIGLHCVFHAASSVCWLTTVVLRDSRVVHIDLGLT